MLPANRNTKGPRNGSSKVTRSWNGRHPDRVPYSGSMGNVSCHTALTFWQRFEIPFLFFVAGAGKSVIWYVNPQILLSQAPELLGSSRVIQEVEAMRKCGLASLAFYYHDFREDVKKDRRGLLSSVLHQLCDQSDSYHDIVSTLYSTHDHGAQSPSNDELFQCFKSLLELPGQAPVYLIIDALDECPNTSAMPSPREEILTLLEQLVESRLTNLRLCVTSRPEIDIKIVLGPLTSLSISIHNERGQTEDIENYIRSVVNGDPRNRRWKREDKELVIKVLTERADGM